MGIKKVFFSPLLFLFLFFIPALAFGWQGVVVKVIDGDSIQIRHGKTVKEIRLYGIDAPEYKQPFGNKAKKALRKKILRETVIVEGKKIDRYGRVVALVSHKGELINRSLVKSGLAWVSSKYCRTQPLCMVMKKDETEARKAKRGLWGDPASLPPWRWKRLKK
jgi:endonuclease YncB( thermonuclease family)